jgi:hypothetical protein
LRRALLAAAAALALGTGAARADDYVTLRGAYYREPSTRVIQPTVEVERDDVVTGVDVKAHFLVDAITSASVAAGTTVDTIFTETRNEAGLSIRLRLDRTEVTLAYKYSAESDYWSHAGGVSIAQRLWGDTARLGLSLGFNHDTISSRFRTPYCATPPSHACTLSGYPLAPGELGRFFGLSFVGLSYTQVLSPVLLAQISLESSYLRGFQANLYRTVPNFSYEQLPSTRLRNAVAARVAYHVVRTGTSLRLQYRYYRDLRPCDLESAPCDSNGDPWQLHSHTVEARVYQPATRSLEVRGSLRYYWQSGASFWCDVLDPMPVCRYPQSAVYYSTDPKLGPLRTWYPEVKVFWLAEALTDVPVLGWLAAGTFDVSYGHFFQNTSFGNAHVLQLGYTMPY